jgi:hypothetical protein
VIVQVDRALFLTLTASLCAGAAMSTADCASSGGGGGADASGIDATSDVTESSDVAVEDAASDVAVVADVAVDVLEEAAMGDATSDSSLDTGLDAAEDAGTDALTDAPSDASDGSTAASLPALPDGGVDEACQPFTCELGNLNCRAAYSGAFIDSAALALYACAQTVCGSNDSGENSFQFGTNCAAAALEMAAPQGSVTSFCAPLSICSDAGTQLSVAQCERYFSSLTAGALGTFRAIDLHDGGLTCTDTGSMTFELLDDLAPN